MHIRKLKIALRNFLNDPPTIYYRVNLIIKLSVSDVYKKECIELTVARGGAGRIHINHRVAGYN